MAQEEKELLLKDLCARLPYGVSCYYETSDESETMFGKLTFRAIESFATNKPLVSEKDNNMVYFYKVISIKPYLRPLSSMTEEECMELSKIRPFDDDVEAWKYVKTPVPLTIANIKHFDFFHSHHLDWRGLIEKGLALEAPEGMYKKGE